MTDNDVHIAATSDDDRLRQIFDDYRPELGPDADFMARIGRSLDTVESLRTALADARRRNRRALVWATLAGMVAGALLTAAVPGLRSLFAVPVACVPLIGPMLAGAGAVLAAIATFSRLRDSVPALRG